MASHLGGMVTLSGPCAPGARPGVSRNPAPLVEGLEVTANIASPEGGPVADERPIPAGGPAPVVGLMILSGAVTALIGVAILAWPEVTVGVVAVLLAIQLFVTGVIHIVQAVVTDDVTLGSRTLLALSGALALLVGLLLLRDPLQTVAVVALLLGGLLVIHGVFRLIDGVRASRGARGWDLAAGAVSLLVGAFVMVQPELSLRALVSVVGLWQIAVGILMVVAGLALRRDVS
jgi:uncharacterized membrane protein HdeD (DUF308 family)